ncbi:methyltransferase domain-containing protein [Caproiciproducens sp. NJN-50]|uniref:class I SAM-dependent methyltransferase n=1 Tax=Acutalibacteraceae TaxID=3082771 RepID=UPI000FFE2B5B|nr:MULTISPECIES: methyltransferase domain-containing protein [Acutalibacteraceae]QAT50802.1 methyltransferase domain-containing protein [Caproiciproducens sp. NJN-50]
METNNIWEAMASHYDTDTRVEVANRIAQAIRAELSGTEGKTAVDYGCGTGLVGLQLLGLFQSVLFVDPSARMIEQVDRKIAAGQIPRARTLCCDFLKEVPDGLLADYVILSQVLLHIPDSRSILTSLYSVLKKDGHLIIADFDKNDAVVSEMVHNGFEQEELIQLLRETGFASATAHTFYHGKGIFMNQDASLFILNAVK